MREGDVETTTETYIRQTLTVLDTSAPPPLVQFVRHSLARLYPSEYAAVQIQTEAAALLDRMLAFESLEPADGATVFRGMDLVRLGALERAVERRLRQAHDRERLETVARLIRQRRRNLDRSARGAVSD